MKVYFLAGEADTLSFGARLAGVLRAGDIVLLEGELGAGKTCLVRGVAGALGCGEQVTSPTFTLMNIYDTLPPIYHFDLYRLDGLGEDFDDYLFGSGVSFIEWPAAAADALSGARLSRIFIEYSGEGRLLRIEGELEERLDD